MTSKHGVIDAALWDSYQSASIVGTFLEWNNNLYHEKSN